MREGFVAPDEQEFDRAVSMMAKMASAKPPLDATPQRLASLVALGVMVHDRAVTNIELQWSLDSEGFVEDAIRALRRHVDILRWSYETAEAKGADALAQLYEAAPVEWTDKMEQGLEDLEPLRARIAKQVEGFLVHAKKQGVR